MFNTKSVYDYDKVSYQNQSSLIPRLEKTRDAAHTTKQKTADSGRAKKFICARHHSLF